MEINLWQLAQFIRNQNKLKKRGMKMNQITVVNEKSLENLMTSLDIAELTGKRHADIMRDIRSEINELGTEIGERIFAHTSYKDKSNRDSPCYNLGKDGAMQLALKYDAMTRYKVIKYIEELEMQLAQSQHSYMITDPIERAKKWIEEQQEKQLLLEESAAKDKLIEQQKPKVLFAESVSASDTSILIREFSKILKQNNIDFGEKRLFHWLRENGYLIKRPGNDYNSPTQRSMEMKLFEIKETTINRTNGITIARTPKITGKGQLYFLGKLREVSKDEFPSHQEIS